VWVSQKLQLNPKSANIIFSWAEWSITLSKHATTEPKVCLLVLYFVNRMINRNDKICDNWTPSLLVRSIILHEQDDQLYCQNKRQLNWTQGLLILYYMNRMITLTVKICDNQYQKHSLCSRSRMNSHLWMIRVWIHMDNFNRETCRVVAKSNPASPRSSRNYKPRTQER